MNSIIQHHIKPVALPKAKKPSEIAGEAEEDPLSQPPEHISILPLKGKIAKPQISKLTKHSIPSYPISHRLKFLQTYFPDLDPKLWNDWQWQIANRIRTLTGLERFLQLKAVEKAAMVERQAKLPLAITPYYLSLLVDKPADHALRRTVVPTTNEFVRMPDESDDPLEEENQSPIPGLVHRYPDRVLLLAMDFCSTYCRYCTRSRMVGHDRLFFNRRRLERALEYIRKTPTVRDVLLSGGDPLTLSDSRLDWLLTRLRHIKHVDIIRIGTKIPAVLPHRVTPQLVRMLRRHHPLWMSLHFTHPNECTVESYRACQRLADAGIPLGSQTVLLRHINDNIETIRDLMHHLLRMRVRPYYLYQCDPIIGSSHFRTPVATGLDIIRGLRGFTSGYAVPNYIIDSPGGDGKIPVSPDYIQGRDGNDLIIRNYEGKIFRYPDGQQSIIFQ